LKKLGFHKKMTFLEADYNKTSVEDSDIPILQKYPPFWPISEYPNWKDGSIQSRQEKNSWVNMSNCFKNTGPIYYRKYIRTKSAILPRCVLFFK